MDGAEAVWRDVGVEEVTTINVVVVAAVAEINHGQLIKITPSLLSSDLVSISVRRLLLDSINLVRPKLKPNRSIMDKIINRQIQIICLILPR